MDITSLYYFKEVAKDLHITKTAERLYISQQTLSNHIIRLENYFGTPLLNRKPKLSLTYAGESVLNYAVRVLKEEANLKDFLSDIESKGRGVIKFGASTLRMGIIPKILPKFSERYPNVEFRLEATISRTLEPLVEKGDIDIALITIDVTSDNPELLSEQLSSDDIFLCVSDKLLKQYYSEEEAEAIKERSLEAVNLQDFSRLPFIIFTNRMGKLIQNCFTEANVSPHHYIETSHVHLSTNLGFSGAAAFFAPRMALANRINEIPADMNIFPMYYNGERLTLPIFLVNHSRRYETTYMRYFKELIRQHFLNIEHIHLTRKATAEGHTETNPDRADIG